MHDIIIHWPKLKKTNHYVYRFALVAFIFSIANGMVSFILPVFLEEEISSLTLVGFILASSSVWNIATDLVIGLLKKPPSYRVLMQLVGIILVGLFLSIWLIDHPLILIFSMVLWGVFTELFSFVNYNFVISASKEEERATNFGVLTNFRSLGFALAPIIIGSLLVTNREPALIVGIFFSVSILVLFNIQLLLKKTPQPLISLKRRTSITGEIRVWFSIGKKVYPLLLVFLVKGVADGVLTSFAPIWVESTPSLKYFGGLIVASLSLPTALLSGYFGHLADQWGRKKYILAGLALSMVGLMFFGFANSPFLAVILAGIVGLGYTLYVSPLDAESASYIEHHHSQESEVESENGIFYNVGFIIGAAVTGILVSLLHGFGPTFALLGILYGVTALAFWLYAPRRHSSLDGAIA